MSRVVERMLRAFRRTSRRMRGMDLRNPGVDYNEAPRIDRIVFICGLHRSGTTLLEHWIHSHFEVACLRAEVPENEGQHLQDVYPPALKYGGQGRFAFSAAMRQDLQALSDRSACRDRILQCWNRYVVGDSPTLLEKSPPNLTKIGWLRSTFPGARFIVMVRDPRAVATASFKTTRTSLEELVMHWQVAHTIARAEFDPGDTCVVRYEDFCASPAEALAGTDVARWIDKRSNPLPIEGRFAEQSDRNAAYVKAHSAPTYGPGIWDQFGYTL